MIKAINGATMIIRMAKINREFPGLGVINPPTLNSPKIDCSLKITLVTTFWKERVREESKISNKPVLKLLGALSGGATGVASRSGNGCLLAGSN